MCRTNGWAIGELLLLGLTAGDGVPRGATSLAKMLPAGPWPPETSVGGALLARFDLFDLWWVPVVAMAVARLYGVSAWAVMASIGGLKLALVLVSAVFFRPPEAGAAPIGGHII